VNVITELGAWNDLDEYQVDDPVQRLEVSDEPPECEVLYQFHRSKIVLITKIIAIAVKSIMVPIAAISSR
jgi:hypothetical protein